MYVLAFKDWSPNHHFFSSGRTRLQPTLKTRKTQTSKQTNLGAFIGSAEEIIVLEGFDFGLFCLKESFAKQQP